MWRKLALAVGTSALLTLAWPGTFPWGMGPGWMLVVPIAAVPLLWLIHSVHQEGKSRQGRQVFWWSYLSMALFNLGTTFWVANAHWSGVVATVLINGALMACIISLYAWVLRHFGVKHAIYTLITGWLAFEVFHEYWGLSFPWLDLGHIFADKVLFIQWYQWTGHRGGTLWFWLLNLSVLYDAMRSMSSREAGQKISWRHWRRSMLVFAIPAAVSMVLYVMPQDQGEQIQTLIAHPQVNPYKAKFQTRDIEQANQWSEQMLAQPKAEGMQELIVFPETFLHEGIDERIAKAFKPLITLEKFRQARGHAHVLIGAETYALYDEVNATPTARELSSGRGSYDRFNSAVWLSDPRSPIEFYHKSKLVVGVEEMPFAKVFGSLLKDATIAMGGTSGTLGTQPEREIFYSADSSLRVAPIICWEQDYGAYARMFAAKGANLLTIMTNDGWWDNTSGHVAHAHYARLRAIENGLWLVRSANCGISAIITNQGDVLQPMTYDERGIIRGEVTLMTPSFYANYGDLIGRFGAFIFPFLLLSLWVRRRIAQGDQADG